MRIQKQKYLIGLIIILVFMVLFFYDRTDWGRMNAKQNPVTDERKDKTLEEAEKDESVAADNLENKKLQESEKVQDLENAIQKQTASNEFNSSSQKKEGTANLNSTAKSNAEDVHGLGGTNPVKVQGESSGVEEMSATLSVTCSTILDNMDKLNQEKVELIPSDGIILPSTEVTFYEGESVFNLLQREMKKNKIQMEFVNVPVHNSAYIEGMNNIYEFDCGELSGWTYRVNGVFPGYGASLYTLQDGDVVEWLYTCDLGRDIGNTNASAGQ